jgi:hypothetical protein
LLSLVSALVPNCCGAYRRRFAAVPFVRAAFNATNRDHLEAFIREAHHHPVFHVG